MAEKENGGWLGVARLRYFSHYSCLVFMVFDRAWSLLPSRSLCLSLPPSPSLSLSLVTFMAALEGVPATQDEGLFSVDDSANFFFK